MSTKNKTIFAQLSISLFPIMYLLLSWKKLPAEVPMHYNINYVADRFGSKWELLTVIFFMWAISFGVSLLLLNINKIDPKKRVNDNNNLMTKISWVLIIFLAALTLFIVNQTVHYPHIKSNSGKYIVLMVSLLFMILGNFMNNVKPNYFVGVRTPWTLNDDDNWRKTHHLTAKIWFFGGLLIAILVMILPSTLASFVLIGGIIPLAIIPIIYSFMLFKKNQKKL